MCQKASGAPFAVGVYFRNRAFRLTGAPPAFYRSSGIAERGFCTVCGSRLIYRPLSADSLAVDVGSLGHPEGAPPGYHTGVEGWIPWLALDDELPRKRTGDSDFQDFKASARRPRTPGARVGATEA